MYLIRNVISEIETSGTWQVGQVLCPDDTVVAQVPANCVPTLPVSRGLRYVTPLLQRMASFIPDEL